MNNIYLKLDEELEAYVKEVFEKVEKEGPIVTLDEVFDHTFATLTDELKEQKELMKFMSLSN